jgi:hypothetical protein
LMRWLDYERYGAVGNDGGSLISPEVGRVDPSHVAGVHVTQIFSFPSGDPAEFEGMTEDETRRHGPPEVVPREPGRLRPDSEPAAADVGGRVGRLACWADRVERSALRRRRRHRVRAHESGDLLVHRHLASSTRFYYENAHMDAPTEPTTVPIGLASFAGDFKSVHRFVDHDHKNVVSWHEYATGGHYAAHQAPDVLAADIRGFYGDLLADRVDA